MPNQRESTLRPDEAGQLLAQGGFADPWFGREHDQPTSTSRGSLEGVVQLAQLQFTPDKRRPPTRRAIAGRCLDRMAEPPWCSVRGHALCGAL
jgi:hypothetical protein